MRRIMIEEGWRPTRPVELEIKELRQVAQNRKQPFWNDGEDILDVPFDVAREYNQLKVQLYKADPELIKSLVGALLDYQVVFLVAYDKVEPTIFIDLRDVQPEVVRRALVMEMEAYFPKMEEEG